MHQTGELHALKPHVFFCGITVCIVCIEASVDPVCSLQPVLKAKDNCEHVNWTEVCVPSLSREYLSSSLDDFERRVLSYAPGQTCRCYQIDKD